MAYDYKITIDSLINREIEGKSSAIGRYTEIIWRIRTGYAVFLYGSLGIIVGLVSQKVILLNETTTWAIIVLIFGFSSFAALLDLSFIKAKLRVVNYRDKLLKLAFSRAKDDQNNFKHKDEKELLDCLKNSGERHDPINWSERPGLVELIYLYGGTCFVCVIASLVINP